MGERRKRLSATRVRNGLDNILAPPVTVPHEGIMCVDPGQTSGLCFWDGHEVKLWERLCWDAVQDVEVFLKAGRITTLVVERYIITAKTLRKTRGENWSMESIGALRYLARRKEVDFVLYTAADAMNFATDQKLRLAGLWVPGKQHARDAARHFLLHMANIGRLEEVLASGSIRSLA